MRNLAHYAKKTYVTKQKQQEVEVRDQVMGGLVRW
jgi:hypothetical protein